MSGIFDTANLQEGEPETLQAGDLIRWRRTDVSNQFDPTLFDLKYSARKAGSPGVEIEITATSDAVGFYVDEIAVNNTDGWEPGKYHWQAYVTRKSDSERVRISSGRWTVYANLDLAETEDPRSHAEKMVDLLESALENRAGSDVIYYMIGGRAISKIPPKELRELLSQYRAELRSEIDAERRAQGKPTRNHVDVRFTD